MAGKKQVTVYADLSRYLGYGKDGQRIRKVFSAKTLRAARQLRSDYIAELERGMPQDAEAMTVYEWCERWMEVYRSDLSESNRASYNAQISRIKDDLGGMRLRDVNNIDVQRSLNGMRGMSTSAISKYKMVICQLFRTAQQNKYIRDNPTLDLRIPEGTYRGHRALERWESALITTCYSQHRAGIWAMLMLYAGLRRGEMIALQWDAVDLAARTIRVERAATLISNRTTVRSGAKTQAGLRVLPICNVLYDALVAERHKADADTSPYVCRSARGVMLSPSAYSRGWESFNATMTRLANGLELNIDGNMRGVRTDRDTPSDDMRKFDIDAHDLRYTFATALYDAGVDVKSAQYYMGHDDIRMTIDLYTQLSRERENSARAKVTNFLDGWGQNTASQSGWQSNWQLMDCRNA